MDLQQFTLHLTEISPATTSFMGTRCIATVLGLLFWSSPGRKNRPAKHPCHCRPVLWTRIPSTKSAWNPWQQKLNKIRQNKDMCCTGMGPQLYTISLTP